MVCWVLFCFILSGAGDHRDLHLRTHSSPTRRSSDLFAKANEKLIIVGGAMGETTLDPSAIQARATLPSLDQLRGKLIGLVQAPATKVAGVVQAPAAQLARIFSAYSSQGEAA